MKKALVVIALLAAAVYVASWFWAGDQVDAAAAGSWPDGLQGRTWGQTFALRSFQITLAQVSVCE